MDEVKKLLDESNKRLQSISDLILENFTDEAVNTEISKLYDIAKEMDTIQEQTKIKQAAITKCKIALGEADEPWNCDIYQIYEENLQNETQKNKKNKEEFYRGLKKYVDNKQNQGNDSLAVVEEPHTAIDPWTKQPILQPVQSRSCNHVYDKRSIACIIRNRDQFKCPYVGCQNIISKDELIDMD